MPRHRILHTAVLATGLAVSQVAAALPTQLEGSSGGGIVPWALLDGSPASASFTFVNSGDFTHTTLAAHTTLFDRLELSYARLGLTVEGTHTQDVLESALGQSNDINMNVLGAKLKLLDMGDAWWQPAVSVGTQYKVTDADNATLNFIGAKDDSGWDFYVAGTKVYKLPVIERNLLLNATVRGTQANDIGYAGFGAKTDAFGNKGDDGYSAQFEGSVGLFAAADTVVGFEYRMKPDNLKAVSEDNWWDAFVAYMPSKHWSAVAAYADLGNIFNEVANLDANLGGKKTTEGNNQRGLYVQFQVNY